MTADTGSLENRDEGSNQGQHRHKAASNYTRAGLTVFVNSFTTAVLKSNQGSIRNNNSNVGRGGGGSSAGSYSTPEGRKDPTMVQEQIDDHYHKLPRGGVRVGDCVGLQVVSLGSTSDAASLP
ncbi:uncharacterized protein FFB14_15301 [Fusarium fujikuroi]|nr:uncharacterized protein FFB14_15301 [Fusarium fujikuroi]